ncbi:MAG: hypothetical protein ABL899_02075 [Nitrospira sp.]
MVPNLPQREEYLRKKRKKKLIRLGVAFALLIFIVALLSYISHRKEIRISDVILSGGILVKESDIKEKSIEYISGSYFWLFPKNNAFIFPKTRLEDFLVQSFKRIDEINIKRKDFKTIVVNITERKPIATWCDKTQKTGTTTEEGLDLTEHCYFIDQNSTIFAEAPFFSGDAYFKYYGFVSTTTPIGMQYMASSTEFAKITEFIDLIKKLSVRPQYLVAKGNDEFSVVVSGGGEIYFDTKIPLEKVAENLGALLRTPELSTTTNRELPVEYIDLRYGNKLFYKLKN